MNSSAKEKIIVAIDAPNAGAANLLLDQLGDSVTWVKIGLQLFTAEGPSFVKTVKDRGYKIFLDLKFHDIPNTVHEAVQSARRLGVDITTIHLAGGNKMLSSAAQAAEGSDLLILGISVLTSMDEAQLRGIGITTPMEQQVLNLVELGWTSGLRGIVCSPHEIASLRAKYGDALTIVTPGVRPAGSALGDQQRVMTPGEAVKLGASKLVIGRPITGATSPREAALKIIDEVASAL